MKKLLTVMLVMATAITMAGCSKKNAETKTAEITSAVEEENSAETEVDETEVDEAKKAAETENLLSHTFTQYGNAKITIVGSELIQDDWGDDVLRIYFDYTNTGDSACLQYPGVALDFASITQDGQECTKTTFGKMDECHIPEDLLYDCPVQPGCTSRQTLLVECDPDGGPVEVSCYIMIGNWVYEPDSVDLFTFQMDPENLMGVPEPLVIPSITNPTYAAGLPASGSDDETFDCEVSMDSWELTEGYEGESVIRLNMTVTNNGDGELSPMAIVGPEAYQDGLGLIWFDYYDLENYTEMDEAFKEDLYPGETVECSALFLLRNENPVEFVIEDLYSDMRLGMICDVATEIARQKAEAEAAIAALDTAVKAAMKEMIGVWDRTDSWEDHLTFREDGTGIHDMTGDKYGFTYTLEDDMLYLFYDDGDEAEYTYQVDEDGLVITDTFDNEQIFVRAGAQISDEEEETESETETVKVQQEETPVLLEDFILGTWEDHESGYSETFTFYADGTGMYSFYEEGLWEYGFTYEVCEDDSVNLYYDDGDEGGFWIEIEDEDTILINNTSVVDMVFVRK